MKTIALLLIITRVGLHVLPAQTAQTTTTPVSATSVDTGFAVSERGLHHRVWSSVTWSTDAKGRPVARTNSFVELATGLHFVNEKGQFEESSDDISVLPDGKGAAAAKGQHKIIFPPDVFDGQIQMSLPDGKWLVSRVLGLGYRDSATGQSVLIAETTNSVGELHGKNVVIYPNALSDSAGFQASIRFTYKRESFEQDIIVHGRPPMPEEFGLNRATTKLEVLTEWFNPPAPLKGKMTVVSKAGDEIADERLNFGAMEMGVGKAFSQGLQGDEEVVPVAKQWLKMEGRDFLIEEVRFNDIQPVLDKLPKADGAGLLPKSSSVKRLASIQRKLPSPPRLASNAVKTKVIKQAMLSHPISGLVLDYVTINTSLTNYTFQGDTTYYLSGNVSLNGTNSTFEGGTVLKYTNDVGLTVNTPVTWLGDSYRPVLMISKDDNTVGESIPGATGNPGNNFYAANALYFDASSANTNLVIQNLRVANATRAVSINSRSGHVVKNLQLVNCANGLSLTNAEVSLRNALMYQVTTNFTGSSSTGRVEHLTSDVASWFNQDIGSNLFVTNSLLVQVTNFGTFTSITTVTNSDASGIFQTVGAASHYLADGSTNRNAGTTSINATLANDLKKLTTFAPVIISNLTISVSTCWLPQAQRDTSTSDLPDIGFHYDPIDYTVSGVTVTNSTLTLSTGVALGMNNSATNFGISILKNGKVISQGSPTNLNHILSVNTVQEQSNTNWSYAAYSIKFGTGTGQDARFRFTDWSLLGRNGNHFYVSSANSPCGFQDCQFRGGGFYTYDVTYGLTNCLWERVAMQTDASSSGFNMYNNLLKGGSWSITTYSSGWIARDNVFDACTLFVQELDLTSDHNAYVNISPLPASGGSDKTLTNADYQTGPLGRFYFPTNGGQLSTLIDAGSRNATNATLYHFTTTTNQVKEAGSTVDIGFHYVATDNNGVPFDADGDGLADYFEDTNGDGSYNAGDLANWNSADTDGDGVSDPLEIAQGRNPNAGGTVSDSSNLTKLQIHTPLR